MQNYKGILVYGLLGILMGYLVAAVSFHLSMYIVLLLIGFSGSSTLAITIYVLLVLSISSICLFFTNKLIQTLSEEKLLQNSFRFSIALMFITLFLFSTIWKLDLTVFT